MTPDEIIADDIARHGPLPGHAADRDRARRIRWEAVTITAVALLLSPLVVMVFAVLVRFALWAITGDGTWAGWTPFDERWED